MKCEWKIVKLGDIADFNKFLYSEKEGWNFVNYLDTGNITKNKIEAIQYIDLLTESLPSRAKRKVKNSNIIYSSVRPNQLHYGYIKTQPNNFLVSTGFVVIDVDEKIADSQFIYYFLIQNNITNYLHSIAEQRVSAYPSIKSSDLADVEINLPNLATQKKIAKIFSALDDKIECNNQINKNLEEQAKNIILDLCNKFSGKVKLGSILNFANGFAFQSKSYLPQGKYKIITIKNVQDGEILSTDAACLNDLPEGMKKECILTIGDVLVSLTGNVGRVGIVYEKNLLLNQRVAKFIPSNKNLIPYLYFYFRLESTKKTLVTIAKGTAQQNLSPIETLKIEVPYDRLILENSRRLKFFFEAIVINKMENLRLSNLRDTLLPKLMSGELDVSEIDI